VILNAIPEPFGVVPAGTAFQLPGLVGSCIGNSSIAATSSLDWSALPASVDADSTSMGVSTRKMTAKQQAKQRARVAVDAAKVQARVARKRAQVGPRLRKTVCYSATQCVGAQKGNTDTTTVIPQRVLVSC
jgi:hypothetical protein